MYSDLAFFKSEMVSGYTQDQERKGHHYLGQMHVVCGYCGENRFQSEIQGYFISTAWKVLLHFGSLYHCQGSVALSIKITIYLHDWSICTHLTFLNQSASEPIHILSTMQCPCSHLQLNMDGGADHRVSFSGGLDHCCQWMDSSLIVFRFTSMENKKKQSGE